MRPLILLAALLTAAPSAARAQDSFIPESIDVAGRQLQLNGTATFRRFFLSIYQVGLYLERPTDDAARVLRSNQAKRLHIHLLRDAGRTQLVNLLRWRLQTVAAENYESLSERVDRLLEAIPEAPAGSDLVITYLPGRGTVLRAYDGRELRIEGKDFADALFGVWLQDARVQPGLLGRR